MSREFAVSLHLLAYTVPGTGLYWGQKTSRARPGGDYLVAPSRSWRTVKVPGPGGISYGIDEPVYAFALISEADFWASQPNYRPVTRLE